MALHVDSSGSVKKPATPSMVKAWQEFWDNLSRPIITGIILVILCGIYIYCLANKIDGNAVLALMGTGLGFLWGDKKSR